MTDTARKAPHFNHVALSMPPDALDAAGRAAICDFYGDLFGWGELDMLTEDRKRLVLGCHTVQQFVYLVADDEPMRSPRTDHFGFSVATRDEFDAMLARARARAADDPMVDFTDYAVDDQEVVKIHSFYVRHLLPLTVEVQWWEWP